jgi:hypothetical protein
MDKLDSLLKKIIALPGELPSIMKNVFEEIKPVVEDLNIAQLQRGERADGSSLPNYSPVSVAKFGKRPGPMTLRDQGGFYKRITLKVESDGVELVGNDIKTEMLQLRYGDNIIGLQEESMNIIEQDYLKEEVEKKLKQDYFT